MSAKEEIKNLLIEDLKTSRQYAECMLIKQYIIEQINNPGIGNMRLSYNFSQSFNDDELSVFKLCFKIVFGWIENDCNNDCIGLYLYNFLD